MSVSDGQRANALNFNNAFVSKTVDSTVEAKVRLNSPDVSSGNEVIDAQRGINHAFDVTGSLGETDATAKQYSSNNYVVDGDNRKVAIGRIDAQLGVVDTELALKIEGPGSSVDGVLPKFVGTSGDTLAESSVSDSGTVVTVDADLVVTGGLEVQGTLTTVNSATLDVTDANITVNNGGTNLSSEGAGLTVDRAGTNGSLIYAAAAATRFLIGDLGSESEIVDIDTAQTLTNKDLSDATNNLNTASSDSFTRLTGNQQVISIPDPVGADTFLLESEAQLVTNKDIDGGAASNTSRITIPKAAKATLDALTRKQGTIVYASDEDVLYSDDGSTLNAVGSGSAVAAPDVQVLTTSGTYTTPIGTTYLRVRMVGGGGGGAGSSTNAAANGGAGGNGTSTVFGTSLLDANAGSGAGGGNNIGGVGGTAVVQSPAIEVVACQGNQGGSGSLRTDLSGNFIRLSGGDGGPSVFGGRGSGGASTSGGSSAQANSGSGGGGAGSPSATAVISGAGGGAGGYLEAIIPSPSSSYSFTIGSGGSSGASGTGGVSGGSGGSGKIIVEAF